ncbi:MAG: hypothetical protein NVSMB46_02810 [Candidatus Saccharimonadales bacterium]
MINLLPPENRSAIIYARKNTHLLHWVLGVIAGIIVIVLVVGAGIVYMKQTDNSYQSQISATQQQLKVENIDATQKHVDDITNSLKLVVQVLSREVLFSKLIAQIGSALPSGTVLTGLSINSVQGGIDLNARATSYVAATQVQLNLQDIRNKIFDKADIVDASCNFSDNQSTINKAYPCSIKIRAQFSSNNPFLFIHPPAVTPPKVGKP